MKKPILKLSLLAVALLGLWFTYLAVRARSNLVTLNVRNADVRRVISKIEWQTWETIYVQNTVTGKVTLNVRKMPLEGVLEIISEQTRSRWTAVYPLYTTGKSLSQLKRVVRGELAAETSDWKAWKNRPFTPPFLFGDNARSQNTLVTLKLADKDLEFATYALARFARAQIIPEDGTMGLVQLDLQQAPMAQAVQSLAKQTGRKWTVFYVLQPRFFRGPRPVLAERENASTNSASAVAASTTELASPADAKPTETAATNADAGLPGPGLRGGPPGFGREEITPEQAATRQKQFEAQLATMSPEERERAQQMRQRMEALRNLPPDERRQQMGQLLNLPGMRAQIQERMTSRMMNGIQNSTPEQRMQFYQRVTELRERFGERERNQSPQ